MIRNVQTLRAIAAMLVVVTHLDAMLMLARFPHGVLAFGTAGVDLFFVVSGFVMIHATSRRPSSGLVFMKDRIVRVLPMYWIMTILIFLVSAYFSQIVQTTRSSFPDLIRSLLFVPYVKANGETQPVLFLGWTLNYEMFFYGLFALSMAFRNMIVRATALSAVIGLLVTAGMMVDKSHAVPFFYTRPIMLEFASGAWIGVAYVRNFRLSARSARACLAIGAAVLVGHFLIWPDGERAWWSGISASMVLMGILSLEDTGIRLFQLLGGASYSLYLVHPFVVIAITKAAARMHLTDNIAGLLSSAITAVALACVVAVVTHRFVEMPMTRWLKGRFSRPTAAPAGGETLLSGL